MIAWIAFTLMVTVAAVGITIPLVRRYDSRRGRPLEADVLGRQLADISETSAGEAPEPAVTESLKTETIRRFLSETPPADSAARPLGTRSVLALALGLAAVVAIGATMLYAKLGRPDLAATSGGRPDPAAAGSAPDGHVGNMIAQLEAKMRQSPNDPEGWRMLGWSYMATQRYAEAAGAYGRAVALDPANADYASARGEALVKAADGKVTPEAQASFAAAAKLDPTDPRARYFLAAAKDQAGDHAGAMADWIALLKSAPPGAPWAAEVRDFVIRIAASRGEDVSSKLPAVSPAQTAQSAGPAASGASAPGGPTPDQVAAAQQMPSDAQQAMIHQMVDGLAARLKTNPSNADGWVKLMRARMVLGDPAAAAGAYRDGMKAFAGQSARQSMLTDAARQMSVPGA